MKKIFLVLSLVLAMVLVVSCAPQSGSEEQGAMAGQAINVALKRCQDCESFTVSLPPGTKLGVVTPALHRNNLPKLLKNGIVDGKKYTQTLYFENNNGSIEYRESDTDATRDFFFIRNNDQIAKYTLEFAAPWESIIGGDNSLTAYTNKKIEILGKSYIITEAKKIGEKGINLTLTAGNVIMGLEDNDITDNAMTHKLFINGNNIDGTEIIINGNVGDTVTLNKINSVMEAEDDYFVAPGNKLSDTITSAGEQKEVIFTNNWEIKFTGFTVDGWNAKIEIVGVCS